MKKAVEKEKLNEYLSNELEYDLQDDEMSDKHKELCEHLQQISNNEVKKNKIDPVIGRNEELDPNCTCTRT